MVMMLMNNVTNIWAATSLSLSSRSVGIAVNFVSLFLFLFLHSKKLPANTFHISSLVNRIPVIQRLYMYIPVLVLFLTLFSPILKHDDTMINRIEVLSMCYILFTN